MRRARPLLGTLVDIQATGGETAAAIEAAFSVIEEVHKLMSFHETESDVSRINRTGISMALAISPRTYEVLQFSQQMSALSEGAFDVTVAGKLVEAGFLPKHAQLEPTDTGASYRDLILLPSSRILLKKRAWIDLGGIAKGYAVDSAIAALRSHGVESAVVNAGGDLRFFGKTQSIEIRDPDFPATVHSLGKMQDCAVATSAGYFSKTRVADSENDPLVDPTVQSCVRWGHSVSVIAPNCMVADALTKVVRLLAQGAKPILDKFDARAMVIGGQNVKTATPRTLQEELAE